jgi:hypothetical protein
MGAAWVWTRSGGVWTQQGTKLVGTGASGLFASQGGSVTLSADGNTALVGGPSDNYSAVANTSMGAVWVFTRSGGVWTQQGAKLVGTGASGFASQGAVALSADGHTALVGGPGDNSSVGAVWVFVVAGATVVVPALSGWGIALLTILLMATGILHLRKNCPRFFTPTERASKQPY